MIVIDGTPVAEPSDIELGVYRISRAERTSSGKMVMEVVAIKRSVTLKYEYIRESNLEQILNLLEARTFHSLQYPDPQGGTRTITVYTGDIKENTWYTIDGTRYWRDVTIGLVEQ